MFFQERVIRAAASDIGMDQAEFRRINLVKDDQFPYRTPFGFSSTRASTSSASTSPATPSVTTRSCGRRKRLGGRAVGSASVSRR
jgi:CO/xanthine dehydrogenase Mo-binding subunit